MVASSNLVRPVQSCEGYHLGKKFEVTQNFLVPPHEKISEKEKKEVLEKFNIVAAQLPKISAKDPAIKSLELKPGDVVRIKRKSHTAGEAVYYRVVVDG